MTLLCTEFSLETVYLRRPGLNQDDINISIYVFLRCLKRQSQNRQISLNNQTAVRSNTVDVSRIIVYTNVFGCSP